MERPVVTTLSGTYFDRERRDEQTRILTQVYADFGIDYQAVRMLFKGQWRPEVAAQLRTYGPAIAAVSMCMENVARRGLTNTQYLRQLALTRSAIEANLPKR
jgi:hypothetical protein